MYCLALVEVDALLLRQGTRGGWQPTQRLQLTNRLCVHSGVTTQRSRDGELLYTFKSALPGGSRTSNRRGGCCILDCVYCDATATFHIIDVIKWKVTWTLCRGAALRVAPTNTTCCLFVFCAATGDCWQ